VTLGAALAQVQRIQELTGGRAESILTTCREKALRTLKAHPDDANIGRLSMVRRITTTGAPGPLTGMCGRWTWRRRGCRWRPLHRR
jgi:hypothetical protein